MLDETLSTLSRKRATDARRRLSVDSDGISQTIRTIRPMQERGERLFEGRREKISGQSEKRGKQALTRLSSDDSSVMSGCQRLFVQPQGSLRRKNALTIAFGNGFQIFVPFPPCFLFPPFVPLFPLQPLLPPIIPLTSSVLSLSLPVCLARPRALYARARALTEPGVPQ